MTVSPELIQQAARALGINVPIRNVIQHKDGSITLVTRSGEYTFAPEKSHPEPVEGPKRAKSRKKTA